MTKSVRFLLSLWYVGILTFILCVFSFVFYSRASFYFNSQVNRSLLAKTEAVSDTIYAFWEAEQEYKSTGTEIAGQIPNSFSRHIRKNGLADLIARWMLQKNDMEQDNARILTADGKPIASSREFSKLNLPLTDAAKDKVLKRHTVYQTFALPGVRYRLITRPVIEEGQVLYIIQVANSLQRIDESLAQMRVWFLALIPFTILFTSAVGWFLATRALTPVGAMIKKVQSLGVNDLHERIEVPRTHDELELLALTFNDLLSRLDKSFKRVRQFSAAAAHELRTPLSVLRGELEVSLRKPRTTQEYGELLKTQLSLVVELGDIVDQLLALAHSEEGEETIQWQDIELGPLVHDVVEYWKKIADLKNIEIDFIRHDWLVIQGEKRLLQRLVSNFLDNAIKHTPPGGRITIEIMKRGIDACLIIQDTGSGIAAEDLSKIFDKFFSRTPADKAVQAGSGLGLGLCRWIAEAHKGRIEVISNAGKGTLFFILFPLKT